MPRRRYRARGRRYYDDDYASYPRRRRGGCLAPIRRFFRTATMVLLTALGAIVFFLLVLLIAFNFALFVQLLTYALFVAAGLAILGIVYLVVRIFTAMSHRISAASTARSQAKLHRERARIERERVHQAHHQVQLQQVKLAREEVVFAQRQEQRALSGPGRTRVIREDSAFVQGHSTGHQSPYRTRNLREEHPEPLVRLLPALSEPPPQAPVKEETELEQMGMPTKGQTFAYRDYHHLLKPGQLFLGVRKDGSARMGSWQDLKILLILGSSASGKTTTVLEKCVCHVKGGGQLVTCDPGGEKPDSLIQRMGPLKQALMPGTTLALEHEDIMQNLERFRQELERRRRGADMSTPILLVVDELNGLLMDTSIKKELRTLLALFGMQARNYNMFLILCAHRTSGLADIRNCMISFICHKCPEMEAEKIIPARYARLTSQLGIGQTFVMDANGDIEALQQLFITKDDIAASLGGTRFPAVAHPHTEPNAPRSGMPPRRHATPPAPQKGGLHRTHLIQSQNAPAAQPTRISQPLPPPTAVGATWGEAVQAHPSEPAPPPAAKLPPRTEELVPNKPVSGDLPTKTAPQRQDTFEMLALRRTKKKK